MILVERVGRSGCSPEHCTIRGDGVVFLLCIVSIRCRSRTSDVVIGKFVQVGRTVCFSVGIRALHTSRHGQDGC